MEKPVLGFVWQDLFGGVHTAGKVLATAFAGQAGAGLADSAADLENKGGLLPGWAGGTQPSQVQPAASLAPQVTVIKPDYVIFARQSGKVDNPVKGVAYVVVTGGSRIAGNGYKPGAASSQFSFAYSNPQRIDIVMMNGGAATGTDIATAVFGGGTEQQGAPQAPTTVQGDVMANPYAYGAQVLGATRGRSPRSGTFIATSPKTGRQFTATAVSRKGSVRTVVLNAQDVAKRGLKLAARLRAAVRKGGPSIVGAARARKVKVSRVQLLSWAADLEKNGNALLAKSAGLEKKNAAVEARAVAGMMAVQNTMFGAYRARGMQAKQMKAAMLKSQAQGAAASKKKAMVLGALVDYLDTQIIGDDSDAEQAATESEMNAAAGPRPGDTSSDTSTDTSSSDTSGGAFPGPNENNYGVGPKPTLQSVMDGSSPFAEKDHGAPDPGWATDQTVYTVTPGTQMFAGIIYYQNEFGELPRDKVGSFNRYYGWNAKGRNGGSGYYWGGGGVGWIARVTDVGNPPSVPLGYADKPVDANTMLANIPNLPPMPEANFIKQTDIDSSAVGPLVGAPGGWTEGLRYDMGAQNWFWFYNKAPNNAAAKVAQASLMLDKAMTDWETAVYNAKQNWIMQQAQDTLDAQQARELSRQKAADDALATHAQVAIDIQNAQTDAADYAAQQKQAEAQGQLDIQQQQAMLSPDGGDGGDMGDFYDQEQIVDENDTGMDDAQDMLDNSPAPDAETPEELDDVEGLVEGKGYY